MRLFAFILLITLSALSLSACNTFRGIGRDLSAAGNAISGS